MRVAVVGGTGLAGRHTVEALRRDGHEPVVIARSLGVDVRTGAGLETALDGADAVVDVTNTPAAHAEQSRAFFAATTAQLLAAESRVGVSHHVVLSVVGIDRVPDNAHYAGKLRQEELVTAGSVPWTVLRATQFHEFAEMIAGLGLRDGTAVVPPLLLQPVAVSDVAEVLAGLAVGPPHRAVLELAGPRTEDLVDMARRTFAARGEDVRIEPSWRGLMGVEMAGEVLLPGPRAVVAPTTFDAWLARLCQPSDNG